MSVTEEQGGRLNAFANEPKIEVINPKDSQGKGLRLILALGIIIIIGLIGFKLGKS